MIKIALRSLYISSMLLVLTINVLYATNQITVLTMGGGNPLITDYSSYYFGFESFYQSITLNPMNDGLNALTTYISALRKNISQGMISSIDISSWAKIFQDPTLLFGQIFSTLWNVIYTMIRMVWLVFVTIAYIIYCIFWVFSWLVTAMTLPRGLPSNLTTL